MPPPLNTCAWWSSLILRFQRVCRSFQKIRFTRGRRKRHHHHFLGLWWWYHLEICLEGLILEALRPPKIYKMPVMAWFELTRSDGNHGSATLTCVVFLVPGSSLLNASEGFGRFTRPNQPNQTLSGNLLNIETESAESAESAESDPFWEFVEHRNRFSRISWIVPGLSLLILRFQRVCIRSFKN